MAKKKKDVIETTDEQIEEALNEGIKRGHIKQIGEDMYELTEEGNAYVDDMARGRPH